HTTKRATPGLALASSCCSAVEPLIAQSFACPVRAFADSPMVAYLWPAKSAEPPQLAKENHLPVKSPSPPPYPSKHRSLFSRSLPQNTLAAFDIPFSMLLWLFGNKKPLSPERGLMTK